MIAIWNLAPIEAGAKAERRALERLRQRAGAEQVAITVDYAIALLEAAVALDEVDRITSLRVIRPGSDSEAGKVLEATEGAQDGETASEGAQGPSTGVLR